MKELTFENREYTKPDEILYKGSHWMFPIVNGVITFGNLKYVIVKSQSDHVYSCSYCEFKDERERCRLANITTCFIPLSYYLKEVKEGI